MSTSDDDQSVDLSVRLRRGSSDSRETFYMDLDRSVEKDVEAVSKMGPHLTPASAAYMVPLAQPHLPEPSQQQQAQQQQQQQLQQKPIAQMSPKSPKTATKAKPEADADAEISSLSSDACSPYLEGGDFPTSDEYQLALPMTLPRQLPSTQQLYEIDPACQFYSLPIPSVQISKPRTVSSKRRAYHSPKIFIQGRPVQDFQVVLNNPPPLIPRPIIVEEKTQPKMPEQRDKKQTTDESVVSAKAVSAKLKEDCWAGLEPPDTPPDSPETDAQLLSSSSSKPTIVPVSPQDSPDAGHPPPAHETGSQVDLARGSEDSGLGTTTQCLLSQSSHHHQRRRPNPSLALDLSGVQRMPPSRSSSFASLSCAAHVGPMQDSVFYSPHLENDALVVMLSAVYAKLLVVMGICFPLAEVISHKIPVSYYEAFYLYLYCGSIAFLIYVYLFLLRSDHPPSSPSPLKRDSSSKRSLVERILRRPQANGAPPAGGGLPRTNSAASGYFEHGMMKKKVDDVAHCGSFYLRLGAVAFGIGSMIYSGLEFGQFFEVDEDSHCYNILYSISPTAHMVFTFIQLYFIFLNSRCFEVTEYKSVARFGLMHMIATNLCIWLRVLVQETKHQIVRLINPNETKFIPSFVHDAYDHAFDPTVVPMPSHVVTEAPLGHHVARRSIEHTNHYSSHECRRSNIMGQLVQDASPFLFPCTIEYSLICAAILYIMWKNTGKSSRSYMATSDGASLHSAIHPRGDRTGTPHPHVTHAQQSHVSKSPHHHTTCCKQRHYYQVDCAKANKGLFTGILVLVLSIICLIVFFVLINKPQYKNLAVLEAHIAELSLYCLTSLAVIIALYQVHEMKFCLGRNFELDNILLVVAQTGLYLFTMFSIIGGHFTIDDNTILVLLTALACLVQGTLQTIFILDASRRCARNNDQVRRKPGREMVTFLLVCNFAMWAINTLETRRADSNPVQMHFYGFWAWTIITHVTTPLTIFFRFHSTVCLCDIWKRTYKVKADYV